MSSTTPYPVRDVKWGGGGGSLLSPLRFKNLFVRDQYIRVPTQRFVTNKFFANPTTHSPPPLLPLTHKQTQAVCKRTTSPRRRVQ
jgi:hypothetical protein